MGTYGKKSWRLCRRAIRGCDVALVKGMYIRTVEGKKNDGILGHGIRFRSHCRRLRQDYGLHIRIHPRFGYINKKLYPQLWDRVLIWLIDW